MLGGGPERCKCPFAPIGPSCPTSIVPNVKLLFSFQCNKKRITDYPNILGYTKDLFQYKGIGETVNMFHIKHHYMVCSICVVFCYFFKFDSKYLG